MTTPVTIVRRFYDALGRGEVPAVLSLLDAQVEWTEAERFPYQRRCLLYRLRALKVACARAKNAPNRQSRRELLWLGVTAHPTAEWLARQLTEAAAGTSLRAT